MVSLAPDYVVHQKQFMTELLSCEPLLIQALENEGNTPIHFAAASPLDEDGTPSIVNEDLIRSIVEHYGAGTLTAVNKFSLNPLVWAILKSENPAATVKCLLTLMTENNLDINEPDKHGWTALHWAVFLRRCECIRLLMNTGVALDKINSHGRTPLHLVGYAFPAVDEKFKREVESYGDRDISRVLNARGYSARKAQADDSISQQGLEDMLSRGADATVRDNDGNLPFFLAAVSSRVPETFLMVRAAATKGLFESSPANAVGKKRMTNKTSSIDLGNKPAKSLDVEK